MPLGDERGDRNQSPSPSTLPSIRELFGIRTGGLSIHHPQHHSSPYSSPSARIARSQQPTDNLGTLVSTTQRAHRLGQPPPSAFPQQPLPSPAHGSPEPMHPIPVRSSSFSAGQVAGVNHIAQDRRSPPATRSPSSSITYATSPDQFNSRSARYPPSSHSPTSVGSQVLPPISVVVPEILPSNRVRAVSDSEALTRASFSSSSSSGHGAVRPVQPSFVENTAPSPQHLGSHTDTRADSTINHRRHVGRNTVQAPSGAHYPSSSRSHSRSIAQSSGLSDDAEQAAPWSTCSRSSSRNTIDYASASSTQEYPPHPYSPASLAARPGTSLQYSPVNHGGSSSSHSGYHGIEGPPYPAYVRGSERAPPSSFPQHGSHGSGNRPRSGNSSEGDETKSGYGKYQCEYCPKRFNRPSSLKIHINTHTGEKPFQCPFPKCGRRFSVMSNMRRHARTHGSLIAPTSAEDENGGSPYQDGPAHGGPSPPAQPAVSQLQTSAASSGRESQELGRRWPESAMEVDELEDEDGDEEMESDGGRGSSESDSYPPSRRPRASEALRPSIKYGMLAKIRIDT